MYLLTVKLGNKDHQIYESKKCDCYVNFYYSMIVGATVL